jgi:hypothetical protein
MKAWIVVRSDDRRIVLNVDAGWVDRDAEPGPTLFAEELAKTSEPPLGAEWEEHELT